MHENQQEIDSVCTYCGVGCDIVGVVTNNTIEKIYASKDGYVSQGKLCIKGKYGFDFVASDARIRAPRIKKAFLEKNPQIKAAIEATLKEYDSAWFTCSVDAATTAAAMKMAQIKAQYGGHSLCSIGGARTSCESAYLFQKYTREE